MATGGELVHLDFPRTISLNDPTHKCISSYMYTQSSSATYMHIYIRLLKYTHAHIFYVILNIYTIYGNVRFRCALLSGKQYTRETNYKSVIEILIRFKFSTICFPKVFVQAMSSLEACFASNSTYRRSTDPEP